MFLISFYDRLGKDLDPAVAQEKLAHRTLSDDKWVWLWVSWTGGLIRLGAGTTVGDNVLIYYGDTNPIEVNYISVRGWRTPAAFHFPFHVNY